MTPFAWTAAAKQPPPSRPDYAQRRWTRVRPGKPCPICHHTHWCSLSTDGEAAICMRVQDGSARTIELDHGTGYLHELGANNASPPPPAYTPPPPPRRTHLDYDRILARWHAATQAIELVRFAIELRVSDRAIRRLGTVYCPERRAWAFPMHDERRRVVGIRLRAANGQKFALPGSQAGAFIPTEIDSRSMLLICEGPTDTAAALTLGFPAIGRPSCTGAAAIITELLAAGRRRDVVIVADADTPGRRGANALADRLLGICRGVKVVVATPHKDLRAWLAAGATHDAVAARIENANWYTRKEEPA